VSAPATAGADTQATPGLTPPAPMAEAPANPLPPAPVAPAQAVVPAAPGALATMAGPAGLRVTGVTYSDNPAHRMLIVNGKIVHEGQDIEPGHKLETITPHSAVVNHQGRRYNINY
jgi:general secretion pathway protein B